MQRDAQREVYTYMSPKLYRTCKRYLKKEEEIEEVLADAFYTIFTKLDQLKEVKHAQVSIVPDTNPFVLFKLAQVIMHWTFVELNANLVWQAQSVVDPETKPVE